MRCSGCSACSAAVVRGRVPRPACGPTIIGHTLRSSPYFQQVEVSSDAVQPSARVVWCLKRRTTDVRCLVLSLGMPVEVRVLHDRDVVVTEMFQEEWMALQWAHAYRERLRAQGWNDVPEGPVTG